MSRIALLLLALVLTMGTTIGCKEEATTPPTSTDPAAPTGDADKDGEANAADGAAADPTEK
jgi:hypothetical protein